MALNNQINQCLQMNSIFFFSQNFFYFHGQTIHKQETKFDAYYNIFVLAAWIVLTNIAYISINEVKRFDLYGWHFWINPTKQNYHSQHLCERVVKICISFVCFFWVRRWKLACLSAKCMAIYTHNIIICSIASITTTTMMRCRVGYFCMSHKLNREIPCIFLNATAFMCADWNTFICVAGNRTSVSCKLVNIGF